MIKTRFLSCLLLISSLSVGSLQAQRNKPATRPATTGTNILPNGSLELPLPSGTATAPAVPSDYPRQFIPTSPDDVFFEADSVAAMSAEDDEDSEDLRVIGARDTIDLESLMRDAIVTLVDDRPLCRPDCAGLCPGCGEKWDDLPEDHEHVVVDPRMAGLAALLDTMTADETSEEHTS